MPCRSPIKLRSGDVVPCSRCYPCLQKKRTDWCVRLLHELKRSTAAHFITMTYSDENLPGDGLSVDHTKNFWKYLRKMSKVKVRYYCVGEYGTQTKRAHYHAIVFNVNNPDHYLKAWPHGHVHVGKVEPATMLYVTKYVINRFNIPDGQNKPFTTMSRRPGIGSSYLDVYTRYHKDGQRYYAHFNGYKVGLPRYYKDKIFNKWEKLLYSQKAIAEADERYIETIRALSKHHPDPTVYYEQSLDFEDQMKIRRLNEKSTI